MSFVGIHEGVGERLEPLFARHGGKGSYLLSPEVLRDERSVALLRRRAPYADFGTHLHAELAAPDAFFPDVTDAFQRDYPPEVEGAKLASLTEAFRDAFGVGPRTFRAGRFGIGPHSIGHLEALGYTVESSVTPFVSWESKGAVGLDFRHAPSQPYHPRRDDPALRGDAALWEVPVTIRPARGHRIPWIGKAFGARWLRPTHGTGRDLVRVMDEEIAANRRRDTSAPCILVCMFHNVEIVAGMSPYAQSEAQAGAILGRLDHLLGAARARGVSLVGLGDVPEILAA